MKSLALCFYEHQNWNKLIAVAVEDLPTSSSYIGIIVSSKTLWFLEWHSKTNKQTCSATMLDNGNSVHGKTIGLVSKFPQAMSHKYKKHKNKFRMFFCKKWKWFRKAQCIVLLWFQDALSMWWPKCLLLSSAILATKNSKMQLNFVLSYFRMSRESYKIELQSALPQHSNEIYQKRLVCVYWTPNRNIDIIVVFM